MCMNKMVPLEARRGQGAGIKSVCEPPEEGA